MAVGSSHRGTSPCQIDGRRCSKCRKVAKDLINGEYLCRLHSPVRKGYQKAEEEVKKR